VKHSTGVWAPLPPLLQPKAAAANGQTYNFMNVAIDRTNHRAFVTDSGTNSMWVVDNA
jgi:hypothetical protein